jgi:hypothetical protein
MASFFLHDQQVLDFFINRLVPWDLFVGSPPNKGHTAIADFLAARVCRLAVTTNYDTLIENAAHSLGEPDFRAIVEESDRNIVHPHSDLLKIHGCATRSRDCTLWCKDQLTRPPLNQRIPLLSEWLKTQLPNRDVLIIGFWSDWDYLNETLLSAITPNRPRMAIVVDPGQPDSLKQKAPILWQWASQNTHFHHIQQSGADFLDQLRTIFSQNLLKRIWQFAIDEFTQLTGKQAAQIDDHVFSQLSTTDLYAIRRDIYGLPSTCVVRHKDPDKSQRVIGALHRILLSRGASIESQYFVFGNQSLRLINAAGQTMSSIRSTFRDEPPYVLGDIRNICVCAIEDGDVPADIIGRGDIGSFIRNTGTSSWETHHRLFEELNLTGAQ